MKGGPVSKEGDVFTFVMVAVEVCARRVFNKSSKFLSLSTFEQTFASHPPFVTTFNIAIVNILNGNRPVRPATLYHEGLWEVITRSWSETPSERPTAFELLKFFQES